jgi:GGDEF domain-containing protein
MPARQHRRGLAGIFILPRDKTTDRCYHYDGKEFAVIMPKLYREYAATIAGGIRTTVEETPFHLKRVKWSVEYRSAWVWPVL